MANNKYEAQVNKFMESVSKRDAQQPEFLQAVQEVAETVYRLLKKTPNINMPKFLREWWSLRE